MARSPHPREPKSPSGPRGALARAARVVAAATLLPTAGPSAQLTDALPPDPHAIVAQTFANLYGFSAVQLVEIRSRRADRREFVRRAQIVRQGVRSSLNRLLVRFTGSGELQGIGMLLLERPDYGYDAFVYQPALRRVRRVTVAQRQDSFFGTDVFFEDLEARRAAQWPARFLREEAIGKRNTWVLELVPQGVPSGYERIVGWFDQQRPIMLRAEFYRQGRRVKVLEVDPTEIQEIGGYHIPTRMTFRGEQGSVTTVVIGETDLREAIPSERFTTSSLEFGDARSDAATSP